MDVYWAGIELVTFNQNLLKVPCSDKRKQLYDLLGRHLWTAPKAGNPNDHFSLYVCSTGNTDHTEISKAQTVCLNWTLTFFSTR